MIDSGPQTLVLEGFELEGGRAFERVPVAYRTYGTPGPVCTLVCHALTGDAHAADWWSGLVGPGKAIDPAERFVVCCNVIGSPYGTLSPLTPDPSTGRRYGAAFPISTIRDTVRLHRHVLDHLGVERVELAIGGSMGGIQVLEWALLDGRVAAIAPLACGAEHRAWAIGWGEVERQAIYADPDWRGGDYPPERPPHAGLSVARMAAMLSYRAPQGFDDRHGRTRMPQTHLFAAQSYLRYQGEKFTRRFDPLCYVRLTQQMDTHDLARDRGGLADVLARIEQPALVASIDTDGLYPPSEQQALAAGLPHATLAPIASPHGHDAFLIEYDQLAHHITPWLAHLGASV